jgi:tetratricopeptide (TPR) repeat protein
MESLVQLYTQHNNISVSSKFKNLIEKIRKVRQDYFFYYAMGVYELLIAKNIIQTEKENKLSESEKFFLKSIESNKYYTLSYFYLMEMHISEKKFNEAINIIQKSLLVLPNGTGFLTNLGDVYYYLGNFEKSDSIFDIVLNLKPDDGDVIMKSIFLKIKFEKYQDAIKLIEIYPKYYESDNYSLETFKIILDIKQGKDVRNSINYYLDKYPDFQNKPREFLIQIMQELNIDYKKYLSD